MKIHLIFPFHCSSVMICLLFRNIAIKLYIINTTMRNIISKNPYSGIVRQTVNFITHHDLNQKILRAHQGFEIQRKRSLQERAGLIRKLGECIQERHKQVAETITFEMGKPITDAEAQVTKTVNFCHYYSKNFDSLQPQPIKTDAKKHTLIKYFPTGTIYYIVPFNYPFYLNFKGGLPNLLLGNSLLTRNADTCPNVGRLTEELMIQAGFNNGEYQNVYTSNDQIDQVFSHDSVSGVSFTGSSKGGALIAEKAGRYLKRAVMELGGNDAFVVLADGDVNLAVSAAIRGRSTNAGQTCFSPKRFIIAKNHYESFRTKLIEALIQIKFGDPMDRDTKMGPLARDDLHDNLTRQLEELPKSYNIFFQRSQMKKPFFPITVIEGSDQVWDEELFGPIFQLFRAQDEQHAIQLANSGHYGLGGSVFSASRGEEVIDQIRCGLGFVNEIPKSDTTFPSGGVARSGFGRQCGSQGFKQFANIKTHYVN